MYKGIKILLTIVSEPIWVLWERERKRISGKDERKTSSQRYYSTYIKKVLRYRSLIVQNIKFYSKTLRIRKEFLIS